MNLFQSIFIYLVLLFSAGYAFAETIIVTVPTERVGNTPLGLSEIDHIRVHYGTTSGNYTFRFNHTAVSLPETNIPFEITPQRPAGTYYIIVTVHDIYGSPQSVDSNEITKVLTLAPPKPAIIR
jgi:hypothetical protein